LKFGLFLKFLVSGNSGEGSDGDADEKAPKKVRLQFDKGGRLTRIREPWGYEDKNLIYPETKKK
jgi:hypothetical protein